MMRSSWIRAILLGIVVIGLVAILVSFRSRSDGLDSADSEPLLSTDVTRRSTDFEYSELKSGREVFRVTATTSTLTRAGEHQLEAVQLMRFDQEGNPSDWVKGRGAVYRIDRKEIEFREDVVIHLYDGTRIEADWAGADLDSEIIRIQSGFLLSRGELKGRGNRLEYRIPERRLDISENLEMFFPTVGGSGRATAGRLIYLLEDGRIDLSSRARLWSRTVGLSGGSIRLHLNQQRVVQEAVAWDSASLSTADQLFSGGRIHLRSSQNGDDHGLLTVSSGFKDGYLVSPATYRLRDGTRTLSAERITADITRDSETSPELKSLVAVKDVRLAAPGQGIQEARSDRLESDFSSTGEFEDISLVGTVFVRRSGRQGRYEELEAERVHLRFDGEQIAEIVTTGRNLRLSGFDGQLQRNLEADQVIRVDYQKGVPRRALAQLNCRVTSKGEAEELELSASTCLVDFAEGEWHRMVAEGGTRIVASSRDVVRESTSRRAVADVTEGKVSRVTQTGDFRLVLNDGKSRSVIESQSGTYDVAMGVLEVSADGLSSLRIFEPTDAASADLAIRARRLEIPAGGNGLRAFGLVESVVVEEGGSTVVTADSLEADRETGWFIYQGTPRLVRDENLVSGDVIRINSETREFLVEGNVDSRLVDPAPDGAEPRRYRVRAGKMHGQKEGATSYEENVLLESEELTLKSPRLDIHSAGNEGSGVDRVVATGGVEISENGRHWTADRATFFARTGRVVVGD